jgi:hypothetical protein
MVSLRTDGSPAGVITGAWANAAAASDERRRGGNAGRRGDATNGNGRRRMCELLGWSRVRGERGRWEMRRMQGRSSSLERLLMGVAFHELEPEVVWAGYQRYALDAGLRRHGAGGPEWVRGRRP